jgi:hypothetical protein
MNGGRPMTRLDALKELKAKVEAGEWSGKAAASLWPSGRVVGSDWFHEYPLALKAHEGSLDAALRLHEAVLPGWKWNLDSDHGADVNNRELGWTDRYKGTWIERSDKANNPARAWLLAILSALVAQEDNQ